MSLASNETILIVDDHEINRYSTGRILREAGYQISEACSGQEALAKAEALPTLILLDVNLPDIDGFQVCRSLRNNPLTRDIPIVHTSATFVSDDDLVFGLDVGADGYLTRPIQPRVLIATIRSCLRTRRAESFLRQRENELQALADNTPDLIARFNPNLQYLFVNRALEQCTQLPATSFLGKTSQELRIYDGFCEEIEKAIRNVIEFQKQGSIGFWLKTPEGVRRYSSTLTPEFFQQGTVQSVLMVARDVSEQYVAELDRKKFVSLVELSRDFIAITDLEGKPTYINHAGLTLMGLKSVKEAQKIPIQSVFRSENFRHLQFDFLPKLMSEGHGECELQVNTLRGAQAHWLSCSLVVLFDENKQPNGFFGDLSRSLRSETTGRTVASCRV